MNILFRSLTFLFKISFFYWSYVIFTFSETLNFGFSLSVSHNLILISRNKDLKYFTLCVMNLHNIWVSHSEMSDKFFWYLDVPVGLYIPKPRPGLANREYREDCRWACLFFCPWGLVLSGHCGLADILPALIAAPLYLFTIFSQPILLCPPDHISNKTSIDS